MAVGSARLFLDRRSGQDSAITYWTLAQTLAQQSTDVLELGCGRGAHIDPAAYGTPLQDLRAPGRRVIGVDVDPAASTNPIIDEFRLLPVGEPWPLAASSIDLVTCDWVLEHVADPADFVANLRRVLRPGGAFVARTVARHSLVAFAARRVPNARHAGFLSRLGLHRPEPDVFPTAYRMNSRSALRRLLGDDFEFMIMTRPALDEYLDRWRWLSRLALWLEPRLPRSTHTVLILSARLREDADSLTARS